MMDKEPLLKNRAKRQRKKRMQALYSYAHKTALKKGWPAPPAPSPHIARYWHLWCALAKEETNNG